MNVSGLWTPGDKKFSIWVQSIPSEGNYLRTCLRYGDEREGLAEVLEPTTDDISREQRVLLGLTLGRSYSFALGNMGFLYY